jgi:hypothetical protein
MIDTGEFDRRPKLGRYPTEEAFAWYERHLDGEEGAIDELMYYAKRFFLMQITRTFKKFSKESQEEILSVCLYKFWRAVAQKSIMRDSRNLHGYMRVMVEKMGGSLAKSMEGKDLQRIDHHEYMRWYFARIPDAREVEAEILVSELPRALRKRALQFSELLCPQQRGAVQYIINRILSRERIVPEWLKMNYGVTNVRWFTEHACVVIRRAMYSMQKEVLNFASDEEKRRVLDGGMETYLRRVG